MLHLLAGCVAALTSSHLLCPEHISHWCTNASLWLNLARPLGTRGLMHHYEVQPYPRVLKEKIMRRVVVLLLASLTFVAPAAAAPQLLWETKGLAQPESVVKDPATGAIYISNIAGAVMQKDGNGFISRLKPDGTIIERQWVKGLNAPTGLALRDRTLYVADVDELVEINAASAEILNRYPAKGAIFLNDVAVDQDGTVYVSDTPMNPIWRRRDGQVG